MASSTNKKVQVRRFDREPVAGFVNLFTYLKPEGVELLSLAGTATLVPYMEIKSVDFVRDFDSSEPERRTFFTRPKMDGLWVRLRYRDGEVLEGILPNNLLQFDLYGFMIVPPDFTYTNQRIFVPRAALVEVQVLGVIGSPLRAKRKKPPKEQIKLFD